MSLALLETLNDIGASEFLGVQTLTVSVYTTWVTRSDLAGAAQIAPDHAGHRRRPDPAGTAWTQAPALRQHPAHAPDATAPPARPAALVAAALGWIPVLLGFVAPALYLVVETYKRLHLVGGVSGQLLVGLRNTLTVAFCATVVTLLCGLTVAWAGRTLRSAAFNRTRLRHANLGYAVPGTVLAIGLLTPFVWIDTAVGRLFGGGGLLLMGSTGALVCAYAIRFLAISTGAIEAGLARIPPSLEQASRMLGETSAGTLRRVHLPLLRRPWRPARCWCSWTP